MPALFRLDDQVAIVTGATGHLGRAMCEGLAEAGASLAVCSTDQGKADALASELAVNFGVKASGFALDLSEPSQISEMISRVAEKMGRIDVLVNNACYAAFNSLEKMTETEWKKGLDGGVTGPFLLLQACIHYLEKTRGSVINISSMYGMVSPNPRNYSDTPFSSAVNYGAAKAALLQVTRFASAYLGPKGIRVNAISPGPFPNPEVQKNELFVSRLATSTALGRIGQSNEIKGAVVFLASGASSYVTGHNLVVDGGWTNW